MNGNQPKEQTMLNYNNDVQLWKNLREGLLTRPNGGPVYQVSQDGSIGNGYSVMARCSSRKEAIALLTQAGFRQIAAGQWKA